LPANLPLSATRPDHLKPQGELQGGKVMYRIPSQSSLDGNTVEPHIEQGKFMENAMQYQASLTFINGKVASLLTALKGE
jgi:flagellar basal-body rod protein FlgB